MWVMEQKESPVVQSAVQSAARVVRFLPTRCLWWGGLIGVIVGVGHIARKLWPWVLGSMCLWILLVDIVGVVDVQIPIGRTKLAVLLLGVIHLTKRVIRWTAKRRSAVHPTNLVTERCSSGSYALDCGFAGERVIRTENPVKVVPGSTSAPPEVGGMESTKHPTDAQRWKDYYSFRELTSPEDLIVHGGWPFGNPPSGVVIPPPEPDVEVRNFATPTSPTVDYVFPYDVSQPYEFPRKGTVMQYVYGEKGKLLKTAELCWHAAVAAAQNNRFRFGEFPHNYGKKMGIRIVDRSNGYSDR